MQSINELHRTGPVLHLDALVPLAKEIGLDEAKFKDCLDSGKMAQIVTD